MKNILISGGAGFIGSHLSKKLIEEGNRIFCLDNLFTGNLNNINKIIDDPNFKFINHDISVKFEADFKIDEIYNLACPASPDHYQAKPIKTIETCINGSFNMLELAKKHDAKILHASTSEVYGDPLSHPQKESYWGNVNPIGPRACYDEGKRIAETIFFNFHREFNVDIKVVRIFNTFGPQMNINDGRVVSNFIVQALKNQDITIYGDGTQTRSFCYVDDLIEGFQKMMNSKMSGPINLGNPTEITIKYLAEEIIELTSSNSKISYKNLPENDPIKRKPDITLANQQINWQPKIKRNDGLKETIKYFKSILKWNEHS